MGNFLKKIIMDNMPLLEEKKRVLPLRELQNLVRSKPSPLDFNAALQGSDIKIIAEIKKASPSKGVLRREFDPVRIARVYESSGAAAISVLTEEKYFLGKLEYLDMVRDTVGNTLPLLRKDFIFDIYQIYEARAHGADAVLLIVNILEPSFLTELLHLTRDLGMFALVEVHNEREIATALNCGAKVIGINNRDLNTFTVDIQTTVKLKPLIPEHITVVSESGIHNRKDIEIMKQAGVKAVLIGEAFMKAQDIGGKMKELQ